jgi:DNA-binding MarR family transcriptional regulator
MADSDIHRLRTTCRTAADGRRATRALADWAQHFELGEPDFQVLWCLRGSGACGLDQISLAKLLACSPAQVSATVERLRARGCISQRQSPGDRRRNLWQLTASGSQLIDHMLNAAGCLDRWELFASAATSAGNSAPEAAA